MRKESEYEGMAFGDVSRALSAKWKVIDADVREVIIDTSYESLIHSRLLRIINLQSDAGRRRAAAVRRGGRGGQGAVPARDRRLQAAGRQPCCSLTCSL